METSMNLEAMTDSQLLRFVKEPKKRKTKKSKICPAKGKTSWGRIYPDGREVCSDDAKGRAEYKRRTLEMAERQNWKCGYCGMGMFRAPGYRYSVTFEHCQGRGFNGSHRDDRTAGNLAVCYHCNSEKGSKRTEGEA